MGRLQIKYLTALLVLSLSSCNDRLDIKPIEKYRGSVIAEIPNGQWNGYSKFIILKNKDSIYKPRVLLFDLKNYKVGDTIK